MNSDETSKKSDSRLTKIKTPDQRADFTGEIFEERRWLEFFNTKTIKNDKSISKTALRLFPGVRGREWN
jgi:hypothetical protein